MYFNYSSKLLHPGAFVSHTVHGLDLFGVEVIVGSGSNFVSLAWPLEHLHMHLA